MHRRLVRGAEAAASGEYAQVATLVRGVPWTGFLVLPGAMLGVAFQGGRSRWSVGRALWFVLAGAAGVYAGNTPLAQLLDTVVVPSTDVLVPEGAVGPTTTLAAVPGEPAAIDRTFRERGHYHQSVPVWPCVDSDRGWAHTLRRGASLALPASAKVGQLDAAADRFVVWSTHRLALVGRAEPAPEGPVAPCSRGPPPRSSWTARPRTPPPCAWAPRASTSSAGPRPSAAAARSCPTTTPRWTRSGRPYARSSRRPAPARGSRWCRRCTGPRSAPAVMRS